MKKESLWQFKEYKKIEKEKKAEKAIEHNQLGISRINVK